MRTPPVTPAMLDLPEFIERYVRPAIKTLVTRVYARTLDESDIEILAMLGYTPRGIATLEGPDQT